MKLIVVKVDLGAQMDDFIKVLPKYIETSNFSGTLYEYYELQTRAGYMLCFRDDFTLKNLNTVGLFGNNATNEKMLLVGIKYFIDEVKGLIYEQNPEQDTQSDGTLTGGSKAPQE